MKTLWHLLLTLLAAWSSMAASKTFHLSQVDDGSYALLELNGDTAELTRYNDEVITITFEGETVDNVFTASLSGGEMLQQASTQTSADLDIDSSAMAIVAVATFNLEVNLNDLVAVSTLDAIFPQVAEYKMFESEEEARSYGSELRTSSLKAQIDERQAEIAEIEGEIAAVEEANARLNQLEISDFTMAYVNGLQFPGSDEYYNSNEAVSYQLTNNTEFAIAGYTIEYDVYLPNRTVKWDSSSIYETIRGGVESGETKEFAAEYSSDAENLELVGRDDLRVDARVTRIELADGTELSLSSASKYTLKRLDMLKAELAELEDGLVNLD